MKCKKCIWGTWLSPKKVYCLFPSCVKEVKSNATKTKEALQVSRLSRTNRRKLLPRSPKGQGKQPEQQALQETLQLNPVATATKAGVI